MDTKAIVATTADSYNGTANFPQTVAKLIALGVESYQADLIRKTTTYYMPDGQTAVAMHPDHHLPVAVQFDAEGIRAAIRLVQQGKISYVEFMQLSARAGITNYVAYLSGRKVIYFGRHGDSHTEPFPSK